MKKICLVFCLLITTLMPKAQQIDEVSLVVSGTAENEEQATLIALRNAIEQTFGTFVSANTSILNDELVKDEIVSISKGNVKSFDKLSVNVLPNGQTSVSLMANVCISQLISYAKSKGSSAEFAGQTFAMNIKLMELKEKNTVSAYLNMCAQAELLADAAFDYGVEILEPKVDRCTLYDLHWYEDNSGKRLITNYDDHRNKVDGYVIPLRLKVLANSATSQIHDLIENTLNSIKISDSDIDEYIKYLEELNDHSTKKVAIRLLYVA